MLTNPIMPNWLYAFSSETNASTVFVQISNLLIAPSLFSEKRLQGASSHADIIFWPFEPLSANVYLPLHVLVTILYTDADIKWENLLFRKS